VRDLGDERDPLPGLSHVPRPLAVEEDRQAEEHEATTPFTNHSGRSLLSLLRRCGITLVRADIDHALASAERSPDPRDLTRRILADAFLYDKVAPTLNPLKKAPKAALERAVETLRAAEIESLRSAWTAAPEPTITALIDAYVERDPQLRPPLLRWLCDLQPPSAARRRTPPRKPSAPGRRPRARDLDQPISETLLGRLRRDLDDPERRKGAAKALLDQAAAVDPGLRQRLVLDFLAGRRGRGWSMDDRQRLLDQGVIGQRLDRRGSVRSGCGRLTSGGLSRYHPRQEPGAVVPHAGICAGGGPTPKC